LGIFCRGKRSTDIVHCKILSLLPGLQEKQSLSDSGYYYEYVPFHQCSSRKCLNRIYTIGI
jgi:hypothetical protein